VSVSYLADDDFTEEHSGHQDYDISTSTIAATMPAPHIRTGESATIDV
jgi:hypothetical protein